MKKGLVLFPLVNMAVLIWGCHINNVAPATIAALTVAYGYGAIIVYITMLANDMLER